MAVDKLENRAGWVLTGGLSSRMGADKALLELQGRPLALRVADEVAKSCGATSLVGDPGVYAVLGLTVVPDAFPGRGPIAGIEAALGAGMADWNLIVACDMPALDCTVFERLFELEADCAVPRHDDGRVETLCSVYHRRCHSAIRAALEAGVRKITDALRLLEAGGFSVRYLPASGEGPFANLNTPKDMQRYLNG